MAAIYEQGGVVGTICHEPAGLVNIKLFDGSYLVAGKKVAAFTNIDIICGLTSIDIFSILSVVEFGSFMLPTKSLKTSVLA